jgi:hypothetical protein
VFTEKEIFALVAKAGVNANSIPDIHQSLIDDGLVDKAKIGGSNYFWSFRSKKDRMAQIQHEQTLKLIDDLKVQLADEENKLADAKRGREDEPDDEEEEEEKNGTGMDEDKNRKDKDAYGQIVQEGTERVTDATRAVRTGGGSRAKKLARLAELATMKVALQQELEVLKENDPAAIADLRKELMLVTQAANRWTDNIFECKNYLIKKRGMDKKDAMKILNIGPNFDCKFSSSLSL